VFYFGSLVGDTGSGTGTSVNAVDIVATRTHLGPATDLRNRYDHNRDKRVDLFDVTFARRGLFNALRPVGVSAAPTASPAPVAAATPPAEDDGTTSVLTALLLTSAHPLLDRAGRGLIG
jgi:hypothetical protein